MNLNELKNLWKEKGFRPTKRMGQNFLYDGNVRSKLVSFLDPADSDVIVEIGPGFGSMTFDLIKKCRSLFVIEKDRKICEIMTPILEKFPQVTLIQDDIMNVDLSCFVSAGKKITVYGNIPYNISTPLVEKVINGRHFINNVYFVMQEEVVDRIIAGPGTKDYGSLSCYVQYYTRPKKLMRIKKNSFYPVPKVESAMLKMEISETPTINVVNESLFFKIIRKAFGQRRKKAINPLISAFAPDISKEEWERSFLDCGIDILNRAENLSLEDFSRLTLKINEILDQH